MVSQRAQRDQAYLPESNASLMHGVSITQFWYHYPKVVHIPYLRTLHLVIGQKILWWGHSELFSYSFTPFIAQCSHIKDYLYFIRKKPGVSSSAPVCFHMQFMLDLRLHLLDNASQTNVSIHDEFSHMNW